MTTIPLRQLIPSVAAMCVVVAASNYLVQFPFTPFGLGDYLTFGAFTYPVAFLVSDLTNRRFGPQATRKVIFAGFMLAVVISVLLASPRIALASGAAFLAGQLLDVTLFTRLRRLDWWRAPLFASLFGSMLDTAIFFSLAFAGDAELPLATYPLVGQVVGEVPVWIGWAICDFLVKVALAVLLLAPYRAVLFRLLPLTTPDGRYLWEAGQKAGSASR